MRGRVAIINYTFEKGEVRQFQFRICSNVKNETLVVQSATWRLIDRSMEDVATGECEVLPNNRIQMLIPLTESGSYTVELTAVIPPETIKERVQIKVVS